VRLIPVVDVLAKRGAVSHTIEMWPNDLLSPDEIGFTLTVVFGRFNALKVRQASLVRSLTRHGFEVLRTFSTDIGERDIHVTASMKVPQDFRRSAPTRSGKRSRLTGKQTTKTVQALAQAQ
jgi:hypothetical protein